MLEFKVGDKRSAATLDYAPAGRVASVVGLGANIESKRFPGRDIDFRIGTANQDVAAVVVLNCRIVSYIYTRIAHQVKAFCINRATLQIERPPQMLHIIKSDHTALLDGQRGLVHLMTCSAAHIENKLTAIADFKLGAPDYALATVDCAIEHNLALSDAESRSVGIPANIVEFFYCLCFVSSR